MSIVIILLLTASLTTVKFASMTAVKTAAETAVKIGTDSKTLAGIMCDMKGFVMVAGRFGNKTHILCLKLLPIEDDDEDTYDDDEDDEDEDEKYVKAYPLTGYTMAHGYPVENPSSGSAEGYIGDDHHFYGVLHLGNMTFHADPYGKDDPTRFFGAFENDNVSPPRRRRHDAQLNLERRYLPFQIEEPRRIIGTARSRICDLLLLADKEFFEKDANSSLNNVVQRMMHSVAQADIIFRNADFNEDGIPDNIGFSVKYILVLTSEGTNKRVFGNLLNQHTVDGREYLMKFARLRRLSEVCLGLAFSGHAFHNRTLGLSFTSLGGGMGGAAGGLCDRRAYGRSFNTLAIAHATSAYNERVPQRIAALTLAHEMGHSFGAHHDDNFPTPECRGFLMGSQSTSAEDGNHFEFSICSKRLIASTLNSMSYCFTGEAKPYCGNGIVEDGEACDCGLPSRCNARDPCCTPRAGGALVFEEGTVHKEGCSVAPSAQCHPSQGLCCQDNCRYADLTHIGINCKSQNAKCECNKSSTCRCGLGGRCMRDWTCHAAECALLGFKECQCLRSPGGALGEQRMCGICCLVEGQRHSPQCVGAEQAAAEFLETHPVIPPEWPGDEYAGPNVTIRVCGGGHGAGECRGVTLRGWAGGGACVSRGVVGACSPRGVCMRLTNTPRSNLYPDTMHVKMHSAPSRQTFSSYSRRRRPRFFFVYLSTFLIL